MFGLASGFLVVGAHAELERRSQYVFVIEREVFRGDGRAAQPMDEIQADKNDGKSRRSRHDGSADSWRSGFWQKQSLDVDNYRAAD